MGESSEHLLELATVKHPVGSRSREQVDSCLNKLSNHYRIAVLPIEANESGLRGEGEVLVIAHRALASSR
jgi:hypothetical protein